MPGHDLSWDWSELAVRLGDRVRTLREEQGMSQERLAELSEVSRNQIQNIEHSRNNLKDPETGRPGAGNPRLYTVFRLADALGVEVSELIDLH
ncbi:helix-turn-helix domain-containing protein [Occultella kanbiaonis]|uniref:helix-turn-helix domain-containing protein n=1 Tax=Occultella kanbiaonis TaxID=2675754 RepID=UPI0013D5FC32|nr:helix-turn-helix transcriptional regulator [Occultella kanbiaonis]